MKKSKLFQKASVKVPRFKWRNKNHSSLFSQPFARIAPHMWADLDPNEKFELRDVDKLFSQPFAGLNLSNITMKSRYFAVPLRKAVPHFEEFSLSSPSDNVLDYHTTIYDILRGACIPYGGMPMTLDEQKVYFQSIGFGGNANFMGIPWLLDQICCMIFGKDLAYMTEWAGALIAAGGHLDASEIFDDGNFQDWLYARLFANPTADDVSGSSESFSINNLLLFSRAALGGSAPNYKFGNVNLAYHSTDTSPWFLFNFGYYLSDDGGLNSSYANIIDTIANDYDSFDSFLKHELEGLIVSYDFGNSHFLNDPYFVCVSNPTRDTDNTDTFFGTRIRLAPFCAYQKVIYDWFVDLRFNNDEFEEFSNYYNSVGNLNHDHYVKWTNYFTFTSKFSGSPISRNTLAFLLGQKVIDYSKDYFTTCSLEPQAGPNLVIGPSGKLDLMFDVESAGVQDQLVLPGVTGADTDDTGKLQLLDPNADDPADIGSVWAQINESDEITPIKLRWQMALQKLLESRNIGGYSRYTDFVLGQYGIRVPDPFLLRSVYLGGFRTSINSEMVVAKADSSNGAESSQLGDIGSFGYGSNRSPLLKGHVKEHVIIIGVNYIVPQNYYTQGLPSRLTDCHVLDHPHWQFKNVGEQPVLNREIFFGANPSEIFGYQKRYSDKKFMFDEVHDEFLWQLRYMRTGRKFLSQPHLDQNLLTMRGSDGHDDVFTVQPNVSQPFWVQKFIYFRHKMCV